jgi:hypothetical protein
MYEMDEDESKQLFEWEHYQHAVRDHRPILVMTYSGLKRAWRARYRK